MYAATQVVQILKHSFWQHDLLGANRFCQWLQLSRIDWLDGSVWACCYVYSIPFVRFTLRILFAATEQCNP